MNARDKIMAAEDRGIAPVDVPEWGGTFHVRMMSGTERESLYAKANAGGRFDMAVFRPTLVTYTLVDEAGVRLFADDEVATIAGKAHRAIGRVFDAAALLNKLGAGAVDEAVKNSEPTQSDASS